MLKTSKKTRKEANLEIIKIIEEQIEHPFNKDIRFSQLLINLAVVLRNTYENGNSWVNEYNLEPTDLLERIKKSGHIFSFAKE